MTLNICWNRRRKLISKAEVQAWSRHDVSIGMSAVALPALLQKLVEQTYLPENFWFLVILYALQMGSMGVYILIAGCQYEGSTRPYFDDVSSVEIFVPGLMMFVLTFILCQIVTGHSPTPRSWKRHRAKRSRRHKKRPQPENRRSFTSVGGSKSSLDTSNNEGYEGNFATHATHSSPAREKIRSFSEERVKSPPVPFRSQRSASLNLEPGVFDRARRAFNNHSFLRWLRFARNSPRTNEDEGFDSLNGNCSSSCDDATSRDGDGDPVPMPGAENGVEVQRKGRDAEKLLRWKNESDWECDGRKSIVVENLAGLRQEASAAMGSFRPKEGNEDISLVDADTDIHQSETEGSLVFHRPRRASVSLRSQERPAKRRTPPVITIPTSRLNAESSYNSSCESDGDTQIPAGGAPYKTTTGTTPLDWTGVTTNSEECSYSSESETDVDNHAGFMDSYQDDLCFDPYGLSTILHPSCPPSDKVSCTIWEDGDAKKADLSVLDISAAIIAKVDALPESTDYLNGGIITAIVVAILPLLYRLNGESRTEILDTFRSFTSLDFDVITQVPTVFSNVMDLILGATFIEKCVILSAALQRFVTASCFLFLLAVAERTFKQRFLYAKLFSHLTSSRRARRSDVPHFRLNKVRNIKTWLSVRSYIKKRGPQHSIDCIVSAAFIITLFLVSFLCMELVKESQSIHQSLYNLEVLCWCLVLGVFLLRFMTLGSKINRKYRSLSVLITEQINLYLQMEQKPTKKEELLLANNVLKLAADLLKELESPFKISGMSANPILYNLTKIVVLSAVSGVLSEILGFKLKLHKLKLS